MSDVCLIVLGSYTIKTEQRRQVFREQRRNLATGHDQGVKWVPEVTGSQESISSSTFPKRNGNNILNGGSAIETTRYSRIVKCALHIVELSLMILDLLLQRCRDMAC